MNKNLIWLGIGAIGTYLLLSSKKASATKVEATKDEKPKDADEIKRERYRDPLPANDSSLHPKSQSDCPEGTFFNPGGEDRLGKFIPPSCVKYDARRKRYALPLPPITSNILNDRAQTGIK